MEVQAGLALIRHIEDQKQNKYTDQAFKCKVIEAITYEKMSKHH